MAAVSPAPSASMAAKTLQNTSCTGGCPLWGRGGGSFVAAGRGRLALRACRDAGTTSQSGEGACPARRRGSNMGGGGGVSSLLYSSPPPPCRSGPKALWGGGGLLGGG